MTDHPIIPIPDDAKVGDIVWFRDGQKKPIDDFLADRIASVRGMCPGWVLRDGKSQTKNLSEWDCIGFQYADGRKPPLGVAKPKPRPHLVVFPSRAKARAAAKAFGGKVQS